MNWFSPEIVNGVIYSKEVDIWAYGAMLHEIGKGQPPFMEFIRNEDRLFDAIATAEVNPIDPTNRSNISEGFNNLMMSCFKVNPGDRPTIDAILNDPYLVGGKDAQTLTRWKESFIEDFRRWEL